MASITPPRVSWATRCFICVSSRSRGGGGEYSDSERRSNGDGGGDSLYSKADGAISGHGGTEDDRIRRLTSYKSCGGDSKRLCE